MPTYSYTRESDGRTIEGPRQLTGEEVLSAFEGLDEIPPEPQPEAFVGPPAPKDAPPWASVSDDPFVAEQRAREAARARELAVDDGEDRSGFARNIGSRLSGMARGIVSFPMQTAAAAAMATGLATEEDIARAPNVRALEAWKSAEEELYRPSASYEETKRKGVSLEGAAEGGTWLWETLLHSLPDMAASIGAPVPYAASLVGDIAEERARRDGRVVPTLADFAAVIPAAGAIVLGERIGAKAIAGGGVGRLLAPKSRTGRVLAVALAEGTTEVGQDLVQGLAEGVPAEELLGRMEQAAVGGVLLGGGLRGAYEIAQGRSVEGRPDTWVEESLSADLHELLAGDAEQVAPVDVVEEAQVLAAGESVPGVYEQVLPPAIPADVADFGEADIVESIDEMRPVIGDVEQVVPPVIPEDAAEVVSADVIKDIDEMRPVVGPAERVAPPPLPEGVAEEIGAVAIEEGKPKATVVSVEQVSEPTSDEVEASIIESRLSPVLARLEALEAIPPKEPEVTVSVAAPRPGKRKAPGAPEQEKPVKMPSVRKARLDLLLASVDPTVDLDDWIAAANMAHASMLREKRLMEHQDPGEATSAENASTNSTLRDMGFSDEQITSFSPSKRISFQQTMDMAREMGLAPKVEGPTRVTVPEKVMDLAEAAIAGDRVLSSQEIAGLLQNKIAILNALKNIKKGLAAAETGAQIKQLGRMQERLQTKSEILLSAMKTSGEETGRALKFRQFLVNPDMTLSEAKMQLRALLGGIELTEKQTKKIESLWKDAEGKYADALKRRNESKKDLESAKATAERIRREVARLQAVLRETQGLGKAVKKVYKKKKRAAERKKSAKKVAAKSAAAEGKAAFGVRFPRKPRERAEGAERKARTEIPVRVTEETGVAPPEAPPRPMSIPVRLRARKKAASRAQAIGENLRVGPLRKSMVQLAAEWKFRNAKRTAEDAAIMAESFSAVMDEAGVAPGSLERARLMSARESLDAALAQLSTVETKAPEADALAEEGDRTLYDEMATRIIEAQAKTDEAMAVIEDTMATMKMEADLLDPARKAAEKEAARRLKKAAALLSEAEKKMLFAAGSKVKSDADIRRAKEDKSVAPLAAAHPWIALYRKILATSLVMSASGDDSALGRQAGMLALQNPVTAGKTLPDIVAKVVPSAPGNRANARQLQMNWLNQPMEPLRVLGDLDRTEIEGVGAANNKGGIHAREEMFMFKAFELGMLEDVLTKPSENIFGLTLNRMRNSSYDKWLMHIATSKGAELSDGAAKGGVFSTFDPDQLTQEDAREIAKYVTREDAEAVAHFLNVSTGRGSWVSGEGAWANFLRHVMFAPRFTLSRFQSVYEYLQLMGRTGKYKNISPEALSKLRKVMAADLGVLLAAIPVFTIGMAVAEGVSDDELRERMNAIFTPGADFLKLVFGDLRVDLSRGIGPSVRHIIPFEFRAGDLFLGGKNAEAFRAKERYFEGIGRLMRAKLAPFTGALSEVFLNENFRGQQLADWEKDSIGEIIMAQFVLPAVGAFTPITGQSLAQETWEQLTEERKDLVWRIAPVVLDLMGLSAAHYPDKKKRRKAATDEFDFGDMDFGGLDDLGFGEIGVGP